MWTSAGTHECTIAKARSGLTKTLHKQPAIRRNVLGGERTRIQYCHLHWSKVAVVNDELKIPLQRTFPACAEAANSVTAASTAFIATVEDGQATIEPQSNLQKTLCATTHTYLLSL